MLIADRNGMVSATKSTPTARDYVQDGLVAMWDGIENAGWGVHDETATIWKDLVGSYDATRGVALWGENCAVMDGSLSCAAKTGSLLGQPSNITLEVCYEVSTTTSPSDARGHYCPAGCTSNGGYSIWREHSGSGSAYQNNVVYWARGYSYPIIPSPPNDDEINVPSTRCLAAGAGARCYKNSVQIATASGNALKYNANCGFNIGADSSGTKFDVECVMAGKVYCTRLYSRALTAAEVAANYAIDKARFNLP